MIDGIHRATATLFAALLIAGCAGTPRYTDWVPGTYTFHAMHAEAGVVEGTIAVSERGPEQVNTTRLGACLPPDPLEPWDRSRRFDCASGFSVIVELGHRGQDPVVGEVSNTHTDTVTKQVVAGCARYAESPTGQQVCVQESYVTVQEKVTTGSSRRFRIVRDADVPS